MQSVISIFPRSVCRMRPKYICDYSTAFCTVHLVCIGIVLCVCMCVDINSGNLRHVACDVKFLILVLIMRQTDAE